MKRLIGGGLTALAIGLAPLALAPSASASGYDQDTVGQFVDTVNAEANRFGTGHVPVYVEYIADSDIIAQSNGSAITFNSQWAALSPYRFNASMAEDVASGFTPGGCGGIQGVAIHEMGHVIDRMGGRAARQAVSQANATGQLGYDLHGYAFDGGSLNAGEAVAVSFQAVECGSATSTERQIYDLMFS